MRKRTCLIVILFVFAGTALRAQVMDPLHEERIKKLEQELVQLQDNLFRTDSLYYTRSYNNGLEGLFVFDKLYSDVANFNSSANQSALLVKLMNVNNPASLELRKRIIADLQQIVESKVNDLVGSDTARKRSFFGVIRNIFNNPLLHTAASFLPVGTPVMQILSSLSSVIVPKLKIEKNGIGAVKNVLLDVESMINESPLKEVGNQIMPYLNFYDSLFVMNNDFNREMEYIRNEAREIQKFVYVTSNDMNDLTGWKNGQPLNVMIAQFNTRYVNPEVLRTKQNDIAASRLKADSLNETAMLVIQEYNHLNRLKITYEIAFAGFKTKYLAVLKKYAAQSSLLKQYLEPIIVQLDPPKNDNPILSSPLIKMDVNLPAATSEQEKKIESLMYKYRPRYDNESEAIKSIIF